MTQINAAWEVIGDQVKRDEYDRTRPQSRAPTTNSMKPQPTASPKSSHHPTPSPQPGTPNDNPPKLEHESEPKPKPNCRRPPQSNKPKSNTPKPQPEPKPEAKSPPHPDYHRPPTPPQPKTTAQNDTSTESCGNAECKKWLDFEKGQEDRIRKGLNSIKLLGGEIHELLVKVVEDSAKLEKAMVYVREASFYFSRKMSEEEKDKLNMECIDAQNAVMIKRLLLKRLKATNWKITDTLSKRSLQEHKRLSDEWTAQEKREEAKKAEAAEKTREKAAARKHKEEKAEKERLRKLWAEQERQRKQEAREEAARQQARAEARKRTEADRAQARPYAEAAAGEKRGKTETRARDDFYRNFVKEVLKKRRAANPEQARSQDRAKAFESCKHKGWWEKVNGRRNCIYCTKTVYRFARRCPSCKIMSCDACRRVLQAGGTP